MQVTSGAIVDEAGADDEEGDSVLKQIATFVERPLQGDNRNLVVKALEVESAEPAEHLIPRLGLSEEQARYQENDGTRRAAYRVFYRVVNSGKVYVRLTDKVRQDIRTRYGQKKVPRSPFAYKDLKDPMEKA